MLLMPVTGVFSSGKAHAAGYDWSNVQYFANTYWEWCNYDVQSTNYGSSCWNYRGHSQFDHPVTIVFTNNSLRTRITADLETRGWSATGTDEYGLYSSVPGSGSQIYDNGYWQPDTGSFVEPQQGVKEPNGCGRDSAHIRIYGEHYINMNGPQAEYLHDPYWGNFNFATTHVDRNENCSGASTGYEYEAAVEVESVLAQTQDAHTYVHNWQPMGNEQDNSHINNIYGQHYGPCYWRSSTVTGYWYFQTGGSFPATNNECAESSGYADEIRFPS